VKLIEYEWPVSPMVAHRPVVDHVRCRVWSRIGGRDERAVARSDFWNKVVAENLYLQLAVRTPGSLHSIAL